MGEAEQGCELRSMRACVVGELDKSAALSLVRRGCAIRETRRATVKGFDFSVARRFAIAYSSKDEKWRPLWL
jgi:hypothetical protein